MKRRFKSIALLAALSFAAAGCQKENSIRPCARNRQKMSAGK